MQVVMCGNSSNGVDGQVAVYPGVGAGKPCCGKHQRQSADTPKRVVISLQNPGTRTTAAPARGALRSGD